MFIRKIKAFIKKRRLKLRYRQYNLDESCLIQDTASILCFYGSDSSDIRIGKHVNIGCEILSEYNGKIIIGDYCNIGQNTTIRSVDSIFIGELTAISTGVVICDNNNHPVNPFDREIIRVTKPGSIERSWKYSNHAPIVIERNCWIGENSRVCKGVHIGEGSIVAANAVVTKDVPANCIVAGNPARIVKTDIDKLPRFFN